MPGQPQQRPSNDSSPSSTVFADTCTTTGSVKRRLHPVGSDCQPKLLEPRRNGYTNKRSSLILDSTGSVRGGIVDEGAHLHLPPSYLVGDDHRDVQDSIHSSSYHPIIPTSSPLD